MKDCGDKMVQVRRPVSTPPRFELDTARGALYSGSMKPVARKSLFPSILALRAAWCARFALCAVAGILLHSFAHPGGYSDHTPRFSDHPTPHAGKSAPTNDDSPSHGDCPLCAVIRAGFVLDSASFDAEALLADSSKLVLPEEPLFTAHPDLETASPRGPPA